MIPRPAARSALIGLAGLLAAAAFETASAQVAAPAPAARPQGYLAAGEIPDSLAILPPPPAHGSPAEAQDLQVYAATRKLQGQPRWALAARDASEAPAAMLEAFGCALGARLDPANAPALARLSARVLRDAAVITNRAKDAYRRPRPLVGNSQPICVERTASLAASPSYPSGHTTYSWAMGLILAELAPDRATPVLARARAYGESRVVCGVHYVSDIEAGRTNGSTLTAALHANAAFRADMDAARREIAAAHASGAPDAAACAVPNDAAAHTPWAAR